MHRGPVAAAIALQADTGCSPSESEPLLHLAKTDPNYKGLWRDHAAFRPPAPGDPRPTLHAIAPVGDLTAAMAKMDREWDRIKLVQAAGWSTPPNHPDLVPAKEARILAETFAALRGTLEPEHAADLEFVRLMEEGRVAAVALRDALVAGDRAGAEQGFAAMKQNCSACHKTYRN